jgi:hypothetical protein
MKFISEEQIDSASEELETSEQAFVDCLEDLRRRHPIVFSFLLSENLEVLTLPERDYMFYLLAILWKSLREEAPAGISISEKTLGEAEERNWTLLQGGNSKSFREKLDPLFEDYPQEDLLAFLEDALIDEEEGLLTREGREPIFVSLKSILDCWVLPVRLG